MMKQQKYLLITDFNDIFWHENSIASFFYRVGVEVQVNRQEGGGEQGSGERGGEWR